MTRKMKLLICSMILIFAVCSAARSQESKKEFKNLNSLVGTWSMETKKGFLYESWKKINDSTLNGKGFKVSGKDTMVLEMVQLVRRGDKIMYIPTISDQNNQNPVRFTLLKLENKTYTFENKEHDFPQRVIYVLPENDMLHAWIEGDVGGQLKRSDFNYKKIK